MVNLDLKLDSTILTISRQLASTKETLKSNQGSHEHVARLEAWLGALKSRCSPPVPLEPQLKCRTFTVEPLQSASLRKHHRSTGYDFVRLDDTHFMLVDQKEGFTVIYEATPTSLFLLARLRVAFRSVTMHGGNLIGDSCVYRFPSMEKIMTLSSECVQSFALSPKHLVSFSGRDFSAYLWKWNGSGYELKEHEVFYTFKFRYGDIHQTTVTGGISDNWRQNALFLILNGKGLVFFKLD